MKYGELASYGRPYLIKSVLRCFLFLTCLCCLLLVYLSWREIKGTYLIDSIDLEQTAGKILSSEVTTSDYKGRTYYHYSIEYEFLVKEGNMHSKDIAFVNATAGTDKTFAEDYVRKYPAGKNVTVYYENGNPSLSALEPNVKAGKSGLVFLIGSLISAIGWLATFVLFPKWNSQKN